MRLSQRYFCYGAVLTSVFWAVLFYMYSNIHHESESTVQRTYLRHKPRPWLEADYIDGEVIKALHPHQRWNATVASHPDQGQALPGRHHHDNSHTYLGNHANNSQLPDLSQLAIIRGPDDQIKRDEGLLSGSKS